MKIFRSFVGREVVTSTAAIMGPGYRIRSSISGAVPQWGKWIKPLAMGSGSDADDNLTFKTRK